jgi:signal transduction histidine kinase
MVGAQEVLPLLTGIITGSERMNEIVNTMLLMVKIDSRALDIYPEPISIAEVLININASLEAAVAKRDKPGDRSQYIRVAFLKPIAAITTVFEKLIENAIKYTPNGGSIRLSGRSGRNRLAQTCRRALRSSSRILGLALPPNRWN